MSEIHRVGCASFRQSGAFVRGNLHRPYGFGRNGTVFGVAPPHNVEALARRRSPKSGTVALRNLVTLSLTGTLAACGGTLEGRAQGYSGLRREERSGTMLCHHDRRTTKPVARRPLRPTGYDGIGPAAALPLSPDNARWGASTSSTRLASSPMALVTRPSRVPPQAADWSCHA